MNNALNNQLAIQNIAINWASSKSLSSTACIGIHELFGKLEGDKLACTYDEYETAKGHFIAAYKEEMECNAKAAQDAYESLLALAYGVPIRQMKPASPKPEAVAKSEARAKRDEEVKALASSSMSTEAMAAEAEKKSIAAIHAKGAEKKAAQAEASRLTAALLTRNKAVTNSTKEQAGVYKESIREFLKDADVDQLRSVAEFIAEL